MTLPWNEAVEEWQDVLKRVKHASLGNVEYVVLNNRQCMAMVEVLLVVANELSPAKFSPRRTRSRRP